jgi:hypothetical protein
MISDGKIALRSAQEAAEETNRVGIKILHHWRRNKKRRAHCPKKECKIVVERF